MRRKTNNRFTLIRDCGTCGKTFSTTADNPFMRSIKQEDGRYKTTYFCCQGCYKASYKYDVFGNQVEKRLEKDRKYSETHKEQISLKNKQYYEKHKEQIKARHKQYYAENRDTCIMANKFNRQKRKLNSKQLESDNNG